MEKEKMCFCFNQGITYYSCVVRSCCVYMTPFEDTREKPSDIEGGAWEWEELCRLAGPAQGKSHIHLERCRRFVPVIADRGFWGCIISLKFIIFFFKNSFEIRWSLDWFLDTNPYMMCVRVFRPALRRHVYLGLWRDFENSRHIILSSIASLSRIENSRKAI